MPEQKTPYFIQALIYQAYECFEWRIQYQKIEFSQIKNALSWIIKKLQSSDSFIFVTKEKEYLYLDFTDDNLTISYLGDKNIEVFKTLSFSNTTSLLEILNLMQEALKVSLLTKQQLLES